MKNRAGVLLSISLAVFVSDQLTKFLTIQNLAYQQIVKITSFFNIVYYRNTGSAFGMFKDLGNLFFMAMSVAAIIVVVVLMLRDMENGLGFALILGGAAGNLCDRIVHGYVIDFAEVHAGRFYWPAFNIADSALSLGVIMLLINSFPRKADA
ncbi:MAG: signal peptidase II [Nitrospirae bacterium]|nr:signal peptidase II [Nitrospirota bacterium]